MMDGELYSVLGVGREATASEIKQAFRQLAKRLHPDQNQRDPGAEERFKRVTHAYAILSDARKRALYDRFGEAGLVEPEPAPEPEATDHVRANGVHSAGERHASPGPRSRRRARPPRPGRSEGGPRLKEVFGGSPRGTTARRGANLSCTATLDLVEAVRGCEREVRIGGTESKPRRVVRVRIPAGVRDGERLRLPGLGRQGSHGGGPGDLWLLVRLRAHPHFYLERGELHVRVPITPLEAYDGATVEVPTPHGAIRVRVPARTETGAILRVRARGVRRGSAEPGNLFLHLRVVLPTGEGLRDAYAHLEGAMGGSVRRDLRFE